MQQRGGKSIEQCKADGLYPCLDTVKKIQSYNTFSNHLAEADTIHDFRSRPGPDDVGYCNAAAASQFRFSNALAQGEDQVQKNNEVIVDGNDITGAMTTLYGDEMQGPSAGSAGTYERNYAGKMAQEPIKVSFQQIIRESIAWSQASKTNRLLTAHVARVGYPNASLRDADETKDTNIGCIPIGADPLALDPWCNWGQIELFWATTENPGGDPYPDEFGPAAQALYSGEYARRIANFLLQFMNPYNYPVSQGGVFVIDGGGTGPLKVLSTIDQIKSLSCPAVLGDSAASSDTNFVFENGPSRNVYAFPTNGKGADGSMRFLFTGNVFSREKPFQTLSELTLTSELFFQKNHSSYDQSNYRDFSYGIAVKNGDTQLFESLLPFTSKGPTYGPTVAYLGTLIGTAYRIYSGVETSPSPWREPDRKTLSIQPFVDEFIKTFGNFNDGNVAGGLTKNERLNFFLRIMMDIKRCGDWEQVNTVPAAGKENMEYGNFMLGTGDILCGMRAFQVGLSGCWRGGSDANDDSKIRSFRNFKTSDPNLPMVLEIKNNFTALYNSLLCLVSAYSEGGLLNRIIAILNEIKQKCEAAHPILCGTDSKALQLAGLNLANVAGLCTNNINILSFQGSGVSNYKPFFDLFAECQSFKTDFDASRLSDTTYTADLLTNYQRFLSTEAVKPFISTIGSRYQEVRTSLVNLEFGFQDIDQFIQSDNPNFPVDLSKLAQGVGQGPVISTTDGKPALNDKWTIADCFGYTPIWYQHIDKIYGKMTKIVEGLVRTPRPSLDEIAKNIQDGQTRKGANNVGSVNNFVDAIKTLLDKHKDSGSGNYAKKYIHYIRRALMYSQDDEAAKVEAVLFLPTRDLKQMVDVIQPITKAHSSPLTPEEISSVQQSFAIQQYLQQWLDMSVSTRLCLPVTTTPASTSAASTSAASTSAASMSGGSSKVMIGGAIGDPTELDIPVYRQASLFLEEVIGYIMVVAPYIKSNTLHDPATLLGVIEDAITVEVIVDGTNRRILSDAAQRAFSAARFTFNQKYSPDSEVMQSNPVIQQIGQLLQPAPVPPNHDIDLYLDQFMATYAPPTDPTAMLHLITLCYFVRALWCPRWIDVIYNSYQLAMLNDCMPGPKIPEPQTGWTLNNYFTNVGASGNPYLQLSLNNSYHTYFNNSGISNSFLSSPLRTAVFENNHKLAQIVSRGIIGFYQGMDPEKWLWPVTLSQYLFDEEYDEMDTFILQISGIILDPVSAPEDPATDWYNVDPEAFDSLPLMYKDDNPEQRDVAGATERQLPNQAAAPVRGSSLLPLTFAPATTNFTRINRTAAAEEQVPSPDLLQFQHFQSDPGPDVPTTRPQLTSAQSVTTFAPTGQGQKRKNRQEVHTPPDTSLDTEIARILQEEEYTIDVNQSNKKQAVNPKYPGQAPRAAPANYDWTAEDPQAGDILHRLFTSQGLGFAQPALAAFGGRKKKMTKKRNKKKKITKKKGKGKGKKGKKKMTKKHNKKKKKTRARGKGKGKGKAKKNSKARKAAGKKSGGAGVGEDLVVPFSKLNV